MHTCTCTLNQVNMQTSVENTGMYSRLPILMFMCLLNLLNWCSSTSIIATSLIQTPANASPWSLHKYICSVQFANLQNYPAHIRNSENCKPISKLCSHFSTFFGLHRNLGDKAKGRITGELKAMLFLLEFELWAVVHCYMYGDLWGFLQQPPSLLLFSNWIFSVPL